MSYQRVPYIIVFTFVSMNNRFWLILSSILFNLLLTRYPTFSWRLIHVSGWLAKEEGFKQFNNKQILMKDSRFSRKQFRNILECFRKHLSKSKIMVTVGQILSKKVLFIATCKVSSEICWTYSCFKWRIFVLG